MPKLKEVFKVAQSETLTDDEIRTLVVSCYREIAPDAERFFPKTGEPFFEIREQRHFATEFLQRVEGEISLSTYGPDIHATARRLLAHRGVALDAQSDLTAHILVEGIARALAEQQRLFLHRLDERIMAYKPVDPLFADGTPNNVVQAPSAAAPSLSAVPIGHTVHKLVELYLEAKREKWTLKTHSIRKRQLQLLLDHLGAEKLANEVTGPELSAYRDGLIRLRRNHHVGGGGTFQQRQTNSKDGRISAKTAALQLEAASSFLKWAVNNHHIPKNPAQGVSVEKPKELKSKKTRRSFTAAELTTLFSSPVFTGCKSARRRHDAGDMIIRDAKFWIPIIGYFTGARLGELVQLHVSDVHVDGPLPYFAITDENSGAIGSGDEKHIKTEAGVRTVPMHPDLLALGFAEFVNQRAKDKRASKRLFWEVAYGADGQASTVLSKWFARLMDKVGLTDPLLVFHSFRHTVEDAFRNNKEPQYIIDRVIGHTEGKTSDRYGDGISLEVAMDAVTGLKLPISLPLLLNTTQSNSTSATP